MKTSTNDNQLIEQKQSGYNLIQTAIDQNVDIVKLEKLMELEDKWRKNNAINAFNAAFADFQSQCPSVTNDCHKNIKTKTNGVKKFAYASLSHFSKSIKPYLSKCGLSYRFEQDQENGQIKVRCILSHIDGHSVYAVLSSMPDISGGKMALHALASTITYLKRYTLSDVTGISSGEEDDDGDVADESSTDDEEQKQVDKDYPKDRFEANKAKWIQMIKNKRANIKSIESILKTDGFRLTEEQIKELKVEVAE